MLTVPEQSGADDEAGRTLETGLRSGASGPAP